MTSRERVLTALNHEEPDRVPLFIGTSGAVHCIQPDVPPENIVPMFEACHNPQGNIDCTW